MTRIEGMTEDDEQRVIAAADLVARTGATAFDIGYLHDGVPTPEAGWYAHAFYRGARIIAENERSPMGAAEALARRILTGARCACGKLVQLGDDGAVAFRNPVMADGTRFSAEQARAAGLCRWRREGDRWVSACGRRGRPRT